MVEKRDTVCTNLIEYAVSCDFEDPYNDSAISQIADWLKDQPVIDDVHTDDGTLLFRTRDGLVGGYGFINSEDGAGGAEEENFESTVPSQAINWPSTVYEEMADWLTPDPGVVQTNGIPRGSSVFSDPAETFERWMNGENLSNVYLESEIPVTNNNYLVLSPNYQDEAMNRFTSFAINATGILTSATEGKLTSLLDDQAQSALLNGAFTDYGFVAIACHGKRFLNRLAFNMGPNIEKTRRNLGGYDAATGTWEIPDFQKPSGIDFCTSLDDVIAFKSCKYPEEEIWKVTGTAIADIFGDPEAMNLWITPDFFEIVLSDKVFDNTVIYCNICFSASDEDFINLLFDHGASAIYCNEHFHATPLAIASYFEIIAALVDQKEDGSYGTVGEGFANINYFSILNIGNKLEDYDIHNIEIKSGAAYASYIANNFLVRPDEDKVIDHYDYVMGDKIQEEWNDIDSPTGIEITIPSHELPLLEPAGYKALTEEPMTVLYRNNSELFANRQFLGYGLSTGTVVDNAGEPIIDAEVRLYRWLNHDFILHEAEVEGSVLDGESPDILPVIVKTNELGEFSIKNVPYGLYVAYAEKDGRYGFTPFFVQAPDNEVVVTVKDNPFIMTTGVQEYVNPKLSAQIARPSFSLKGNEFVDDLGGMIRPFFADAVLAVDDMMSTPIYDGRKHISVASVRDVFVSDRHVSVRVGSYQEYSNSVHGMHYWDSYTYWLDTGLPVQLHEILDPGVEQASYRLRTLWRNAIYHKGITDEMLWQPLERTLEAALLGDFPCYWSFTSEGLNLQFPLYEAGPYAVGSLEVTLPYHRLIYVIAPEFLPNDPPDELTVENEPVSASVIPIVFGKDYKHRFQEANEAAIRDGLEPPHPVYGVETEGGHLIAVDGYAKDFRILFDPEDYFEPIMLFFASSIENALVWLPNLEDDTFEAVWEADGVTRSVTLKF